MTALDLEEVVVEFPVARGFRHIAHRAHAKATGGQLDDSRSVVRALDRVSLKVRKGDRVGVIGHNGAGKSTLLRAAGGIYVPQSGRVGINGRISALFNAAPGLEIDDNGWQNILNCGLYLGMSGAEAAAKAKDIADFTELGEFLDMPVRTYSSGMLMRLSFAIATAIDPEILLLDEALGTGDARFAMKAQQRLMGLIERSAILVMTSHSPSELRSYCNRGVYLEKGRVLADGPIDEVIEQYHATIVAQAQSDDAEGLGRALALTQEMTRHGEAVPPALEEQSLRAGLQIYPDDAVMLMRLCRLLRDQGKSVPAALEMRAMQAGLRQHPEDAGMARRLIELAGPNVEAVAADVRPLLAAHGWPGEAGAGLAAAQTAEPEPARPAAAEEEPAAPAQNSLRLLQHGLAMVQEMTSRGEPISLPMEEMAHYIALQFQPGDLGMLLRLCQVISLQGKPVPVTVEVQALEAALRAYPDDVAMGRRLRELAAAVKHEIAADVTAIINAQAPAAEPQAAADDAA